MESSVSGNSGHAVRSRVVRLMLAAYKERVEDLRPWGVDKFTDSTFADVVRRDDAATRRRGAALLRRALVLAGFSPSVRSRA
jgi:hypothetical protein